MLTIVSSMQTTVKHLEAVLEAEFERHALAPVLRSPPGLGPVLAARVIPRDSPHETGTKP